MTGARFEAQPWTGNEATLPSSSLLKPRSCDSSAHVNNELGGSVRRQDPSRPMRILSHDRHAVAGSIPTWIRMPHRLRRGPVNLLLEE